MRSKVLWILAGGNGSGKTTFFSIFLKPKGMAFVNADIIAKDVYPDDPESFSYNAAKLAEKLRENLLIEGRSFCFETVFSHPSKVDFIAKAKSYGYTINLILVHVDNVEINLVRVLERVQHGGHTVPEAKIRARIPRVLENVAKAIPLTDNFMAFDNSDLNKPYQPVFSIRSGVKVEHINPLPLWARPFCE